MSSQSHQPFKSFVVSKICHITITINGRTNLKLLNLLKDIYLSQLYSLIINSEEFIYFSTPANHSSQTNDNYYDAFMAKQKRN